ncbi:hypothetical protein AB0B63_18570 [Micromonospora sp. NPDC049081]|uniref:hypothetical protein n=1 Tax=Micromonospora sp. NPDC049081 TaxID=3155150 RepID=UPI0033E0D181
MTGSLDNERLRCPRDSKLLTADLTERGYRCEHCGYTEQFGVRRTPLVTARSARSLVAQYRQMRAAGKPLPTRRFAGRLIAEEAS